MCNDRTTANDGAFANAKPFVNFDTCPDPYIVLNVDFANDKPLIHNEFTGIVVFMVSGVDADVRSNTHPLPYIYGAVSINDHTLIERGSTANANIPREPDRNTIPDVSGLDP